MNLLIEFVSNVANHGPNDGNELRLVHLPANVEGGHVIRQKVYPVARSKLVRRTERADLKRIIYRQW